MTLEEAAESLQNHLTSNPDDAGIFCVYVQSGQLMVNVNFIYRVPDVEQLKGLDNEATRNAAEVGKKILQPIIDNIEGKETEPEQVVRHGDGQVIVSNFKPEK